MVSQSQSCQTQSRQRRGSSNTKVMVAVVVSVLLSGVVCCVAVGMILRPGVRQAARSNDNLMKIALGIHNYHDAYRCLPANVVDADGQRLLSWRAVILPFVEHSDFHSRIDFERAWDEPPNSKLNQMVVPVLSHRDATPFTDTSYVAISGPEAGFSSDRTLTLGNIKDQTHNTIAVVEVRASRINWMEPRDATIDQAISYIQSSPMPVPVMMYDGSMRRIDPTTPADRLRAMMTIASRD